jgi:NADH-quinone oxidoreductase subunit M
MRDLSPRRTLGWLSISQSAFLLAGIGSQTSEGIAGSLLLWQVVVASTTILAGIMAALESRMSVSLTLKHSSGLAARFPRLAVGFIIAGLALVGAPMTLGFCAEDLLMHGTLAAHPRIGILLPIATAMNAITVFRMFSRLFLGPVTEDLTDVPDALPRERLVIIAVISFLILGGLVPGWLLPKTVSTHDAVTTHPGK